MLYHISCITCKAGGDDNAGVPCDGVRLKLFSSDEDFCGWCPDTCVPFIKEGGRCWLDASGIQLHVRQTLVFIGMLPAL